MCIILSQYIYGTEPIKNIPYLHIQHLYHNRCVYSDNTPTELEDLFSIRIKLLLYVYMYYKSTTSSNHFRKALFIFIV